MANQVKWCRFRDDTKNHGVSLDRPFLSWSVVRTQDSMDAEEG